MATPTAQQALDLMYRASTTGVSNAELAKFGGYAAVKAAAQAANFDATPTFIQSYEQSNALPASASTIANQQFIGAGGQERFQQQEADLMSSNAALAEATRQRIADEFAAAQQQAATTARTGTTATTGATTAATGMTIEQAYQQVLGRTPSASEIAYWKTQFGDSVDAGELSTFSVAAQPERAAAPTTYPKIREMYLSVLGREPDAAGLKYFYDRFGDEVSGTELDIFKGMTIQEQTANAARNAGTTAGTTAGTVQPIVRPTGPRQVTGTQLAPAAVTNTAITGTPFTNLYTPSNVQQNAPRLSDIQAATQSSNPYQSLMALTPQRTLSPSYAAQAGQTTANTNLGGFNPAIYNPAATTAPLTGLLAAGSDGSGGSNAGDARGPGTDNTGSGQTIYGGLANLAGEAQRYGFNTIGGLIAGAIPVGSTLAPGINATTADLAALGNRDAIAAMTAQNQAIAQDAEQQSSSSPFDGGTGEGLGAAYDKFKGGLITPRNIRGPNPPGPDDGNTNIDIGEYVIRKNAVQKYGANIFEKINAGQIPAKRLKSLLE
jgi:hypothetical protein